MPANPQFPLCRAPASELGATFYGAFGSFQKRQLPADAAIKATRQPGPADLQQTHTPQTTSINKAKRRARTPALQYGRKPCGPMKASAPAGGPYGRDSLRDSRQPSATRSPAPARKAGDRHRSGPVFCTMSRPAQLQLFCNLVHNAGTGRYFYALLAPPPRLTYSLKMLQYNLYDSANLPPLSAAAGRKNQGRTPQC